jgi:hypothetical protein
VHLLFQRSSIIFFVQRRSKGIRARWRGRDSHWSAVSKGLSFKRLSRGASYCQDLSYYGEAESPGSICNLSLIVLDADSSAVTGK